PAPKGGAASCIVEKNPCAGGVPAQSAFLSYHKSRPVTRRGRAKPPHPKARRHTLHFSKRNPGCGALLLRVKRQKGPRFAVAQICVAHAVGLQIWTAAPTPARLFLPQAAPRFRCASAVSSERQPSEQEVPQVEPAGGDAAVRAVHQGGAGVVGGEDLPVVVAPLLGKAHRAALAH